MVLRITRPALPWISNRIPPQDRQICLVLLNGKIMIDLMVWHKKDRAFVTHTLFQGATVEVKLALAETDGWLSKDEIPLPEWVRQ